MNHSKPCLSAPRTGELPEAFVLALVAVTGCGGGGGDGNKPAQAPLISVSEVEVEEGHSGTNPAAFQVRLSAPGSELVTAEWSTLDGTAAGGEDYRPAKGTIVIEPGTVDTVVVVDVLGDRKRERDETFFLVLDSPRGASLMDTEARARALVHDDDEEEEEEEEEEEDADEGQDVSDKDDDDSERSDSAEPGLDVSGLEITEASLESARGVFTLKHDTGGSGSLRIESLDIAWESIERKGKRTVAKVESSLFEARDEDGDTVDVRSGARIPPEAEWTVTYRVTIDPSAPAETRRIKHFVRISLVGSEKVFQDSASYKIPDAE